MLADTVPEEEFGWRTGCAVVRLLLGGFRPLESVMKHALAAAVLIASAGPAVGQMTGVSHPDERPITTSPETIQPPVAYQAMPQSTLKPRATESNSQPGATLTLPDTDSNRGIATANAATAAPALTNVFNPSVGPDTDSRVVTRVAGPGNELPVGTLVKVKMNQALSTNVTVLGASFSAELTEPVLRDGRVLLPAGSSLTGRVTEVHGGKRISGAASMHLMTQTVTLPDGTVYPLHGQVVDTDLFNANKVDGEGTIVRRDHKLQTLGAMTLSTGSGAAAGAVFGGWPGALIGGAVGAGISTVVWLKQDRQADLPAGTTVSFLLTAPIVFGRY